MCLCSIPGKLPLTLIEQKKNKEEINLLILKKKILKKIGFNFKLIIVESFELKTIGIFRFKKLGHI